MHFPLPEYAYIPGLSPRHDDILFAKVRTSVPSVTRSAEQADNPAWQFGLQLLGLGFFWEAHEVLEPVWVNAAPNSAERHMVQAVIQLANAGLKLVMHRRDAVSRILAQAEELVGRASNPGGEPVMGIGREDALSCISALRALLPDDDTPEPEFSEQEICLIMQRLSTG